MPTVEWNRPKLERFKQAYKHAVANGLGMFHFDGNDFVTGYAKYLIEYLENRLK